MTPFWAAANVVAGLVAVMWVLAPILCLSLLPHSLRCKCGLLTLSGLDYTNAMYGAYMPILSSAVFDNTGKPYDVSKILTKDFLFDEESYKKYSRVFMPIT